MPWPNVINYGCPNGHYTKCREFLLADFVHCVGFSPVELKGHPIVCHTGDSCSSTMGCLHVLRKLLPHVTGT